LGGSRRNENKNQTNGLLGRGYQRGIKDKKTLNDKPFWPLKPI